MQVNNKIHLKKGLNKYQLGINYNLQYIINLKRIVILNFITSNLGDTSI